MTKEKVTNFDLNAAFKALNEIEYPKAEKGIRANRTNIKESVKRVDRLSMLIEEYYDVNSQEDLQEAQDEREEEIAKAKLARIEKIVDLDAESPEDLLPSYAGKIIIQCPQCMTLFYKNQEDIEKSEENPDVVNINETCQHCGNTSGYTVIGKVEPVSAEEEANYEAAENNNDLDLDFDIEEPEEEAPVEEENKEELDLNLDEIPEEEEEKKEESLNTQANDTLLENVSESVNNNKEFKDINKKNASDNDSENLTLNEETEVEESVNLNKEFNDISKKKDSDNDSENLSLNEEKEEEALEIKIDVNEVPDTECIDGVCPEGADGVIVEPVVVEPAIADEQPAEVIPAAEMEVTPLTDVAAEDEVKVEEPFEEVPEAEEVEKEEEEEEVEEALTESNEEDAEPIEAKKFEDDNKTEVFTELPDYDVEVEQKGDKIEIELEPKDIAEVEEEEAEKEVQESLIEADVAADIDAFVKGLDEGYEDQLKEEDQIDALLNSEEYKEPISDAEVESYFDESCNKKKALKEADEEVTVEDEEVAVEEPTVEEEVAVSFEPQEVIEVAQEAAEEVKGEELTEEESDAITEKVDELVDEKVEEAEEGDEEEDNADFEEIEDIDENAVNECISKYFTEVYSNIKNFEMTDCKLDEGKIIIEGNINFNSNKIKATAFEFNTAKTFVFEGINKDLAENGNFKLACKLTDKCLIAESFEYNYKINETLVEGLVRR